MMQRHDYFEARSVLKHPSEGVSITNVISCDKLIVDLFCGFCL